MVERDSRRIIARLEREGWELYSVRGSHHKFRRGGKVVMVVHPERDIRPGTARQIAKAAGWLAKED